MPRELKIGEDKTIGVRATPLALLYYRQEFKNDLVGDLMKLQAVANDPTQLDMLALLQLVWAMAKADKGGKGFPSFETWLEEIESVDITDPDFLQAALEEAVIGLFRSGAKGIAPAAKQSRAR